MVPYFISNHNKIGDMIILSGHIKRIYNYNGNQKIKVYIDEKSPHYDILLNNPYCDIERINFNQLPRPHIMITPSVPGKYIDEAGNIGEICLTDEEIKWAKEQIKKINPDNKMVMAIQVSGDSQGKNHWSFKYYDEVAKNMNKYFKILQIGFSQGFRNKYKGVFYNDYYQKDKLQYADRNLRYYASLNFPNLTSLYSARPMIAILSQIDFYLGLNTGSCHAATVFNKPVISINSQIKYPSEKMWDYSFNCNLIAEKINPNYVTMIIKNWINNRLLPKNNEKKINISESDKNRYLQQKEIKKNIYNMKSFDEHYKNIKPKIDIKIKEICDKKGININSIDSNRYELLISIIYEMIKYELNERIL